MIINYCEKCNSMTNHRITRKYYGNCLKCEVKEKMLIPRNTPFKRYINADIINLKEIGWSESRNDIEIKKYIKSFVQNNYDKKIDDEMALIICFIIDDLLTDIELKEVTRK